MKDLFGIAGGCLVAAAYLAVVGTILMALIKLLFIIGKAIF
ncbi:hypothetical protein [Enterococcus sp. AZ109]